MDQSTLQVDTETMHGIEDLASLHSRTPETQIKCMVAEAKKRELRTKADEPKQDPLVDLMDQLVFNSENDILTEAEQDFAQMLLESGAPLYATDDSGNVVEYSEAK
ncbi:MAG: hypothetical protein ACJAYF_002347 [Arenicella sp.]|jgi:hypothetical protein